MVTEEHLKSNRRETSEANTRCAKAVRRGGFQDETTAALNTTEKGREPRDVGTDGFLEPFLVA